jgi:uncharacterized protein YutE (UPF0331/DUF86 family)
MNDDKQNLVDLRNILVKQLKEINDQIILYGIDDDDEKFDFLIKKAINYREIIQRITKELAEL